MPLIVPTILARDLDDYASRIKRVRPFARRIHIDVTDGVFADSTTPAIDQVYGIVGIPFDLHLMFEQPQSQVAKIVKLHPRLAIIHAEADCDHLAVAAELHANGIKAGLAVLPETTIESVRELLPHFDHLLIFTGNLGENRGNFKSECLPKIAEARAINVGLEIGVDGGINLNNVASVVCAGADVLYIGGAIHHAHNPALAYDALSRVVCLTVPGN